VEFLPIIGIALLFWLFIIRPQSRRQKELRAMQSSLEQGDEVVLTSGIFCTVRRLEDDHVLVEIAEGVVIKVARGAIGTVATKANQPVEELGSYDDETGTAAGSEEN
jgi:preprotein translocase subunit YajC